MKNLGFILLAFFLTTSAIAGNTISTSDLLVHPNDTVDLSIAIDNDLPMIAYQFDVELPIGIRLAKQLDSTVEDSLYAAFLTDRKDSSHLLNVTSLGHSYRFLAYSSTNKAFNTGSGNAVVTIRLIVDSTIAQGSFNLMIKNALYTTGETEAMTIPLADFSSTINVIYRYQISLFSSGNGSVAGAGLFSHGDSARIVAMPQTGYTFTGWYDGEQLFSTLPSFSFFPANSVSLEARFALNTYTINLTAQAGGSVSGSGTISHGDSARIVATPQTGYTFTGWYNGEQLFSPNASYAFMATASMALEARFALNTYTINLTAQAGGSVSGSGTISHGDSARIVATPQTGYTFTGWYNGEQLFSTLPSFSVFPANSVSLEARFALNTYTINLTAQAGGSVSGSGTISHGDSARIVATPQTGYSFTGWYNGEQLFSPNASYTFMPTASMALEARFALNTYTINLTAQAGGSVSGSGTISHGDSARIVATPQTGYTFTGWYNGEQLFSTLPSFSVFPANSVSLEARFTLNTYTINLTAQAGGSVSGSGTISHGDSARIVATPQTGYTFTGWYNGEQLFSPNASYTFMPTASMALEARFALNTYTINLTAQAGGSVSGSGTISHGDSARIVATRQTGYSFIGWYNGEQLFSPNASYAFMPTASMALEARFALNTYTINLTAQAGGSVSGSGTISHGDSAKIVATPQAGYSFTGWYDREQLFSALPSFSFFPANSVSLEARFALNTYTINLTAQAGGSASGSGTISHGDSASIVATPQAGYSFIGWYNEGQLFSTLPSFSFFPANSVSLDARFALNTYTINLTAQAGGSASGSGTISHGDSARIVATPQTGYSFTGWYDGEQLFSPNASYAFMPTASMALEARFVLNTYTINLTAQAGGSVSGSGTISHGDSARIVATPQAGYSFTGWYDREQLFSALPSFSFFPANSVSLEARFALNTYTINLTAQAGGSVSGSGTISHGDSARIVATIESGYSFIGWYNGEQLFSPNASYAFMPTASMALEARFVLNTYTINLTAQAGGSVSGSGTISHGDSARIVATPQTGYSFTGWYDGEQLFSPNASYTFMPTASISLAALFKKRQLKPIINNQNGIVTITTEDEADSLYYTLDSSTPTIYSSKYDKPFTLEYSCIIKAISHKESMGDSEIATLFATVFKHDTLTVTVRDTLVQTKTDTVFLLRTDTIHHFVHDTLEMMVLPLAPIITNRGDSVFITCETEGVVIYYSTDGTTNLNQLYTGPFVITNERTIIAKTVIESIKTMANIPMDLTKISRTKVSQRYYQLNGIETQVLMKGINIVCTVYDDGTTDSIKVFVK